jgi:hypothetical protein
MKRKTLKNLVKRVKITVDPNMVTHENDPFFIRKAEEAKRTLEKCKLPEEILERMRANSMKGKN